MSQTKEIPKFTYHTCPKIVVIRRMKKGMGTCSGESVREREFTEAAIKERKGNISLSVSHQTLLFSHPSHVPTRPPSHRHSSRMTAPTSGNPPHGGEELFHSV